MKTNSILLIALTLLCVACKSDDDSTPERADGRTVVQIDERSDTYGVWRIESIISAEPQDTNNDGESNTDLFLELPPCFVDNTYIVRADGTYSILDTGITCEGNTQGQELDRGTHDSFSINSRDNFAQFFFEPQQPSTVSNFDWLIISGLKDPNFPNKRYLELNVAARRLRADLIDIDRFGTGLIKAVLVTTDN